MRHVVAACLHCNTCIATHVVVDSFLGKRLDEAQLAATRCRMPLQFIQEYRLI
jgi:hypothetical protein